MNRVDEGRRFDDFPATTLYLDDARNMMQVLLESCGRVELKTGDFEIADVSELDALAAQFPAGRFPYLELNGYDPYITVDIRPYMLAAWISSQTAEQVGVITKIRDIVNRGRKIRPIIFYNSIAGVLLLGGMALISSRQMILGLALVGSGVFIDAYSLRPHMRNTFIIRTTIRTNGLGFVVRNKDAIALAAISAVLGALLTYVVTLLAK